MRDQPLPAELDKLWGNLPDLTFRGNGEWSSACPKCGGASTARYGKSDRFRLFAANSGHSSRGWCRRCGFFQWSDQGERPTKEQLAEADKERVRLANIEAKRIQSKVEELGKRKYWLGWHDAMGDGHRELWRIQGIRDELQDYFKLGYVEQRRFFNGATPFESPAMTIPVFEVGWDIVNVQYRLMKPPSGVGKYRFTAGLPAPLFLSYPESAPTGPTLLVEGAKKGIVCFDKLDDFYIVAVPSKMPKLKMLDQLSDCEPIYIALDPDAYDDGPKSSAARIGNYLNGRARYVRLPAKPDDFFTMYRGKTSQFLSYVRQATRSIQ